MFRKTLTLVSAAVVGLTASAASAGDWGFYRPSYGYRHERLHDQLEHREFHRELEHRDAHRYPMAWSEHERLHDVLEHDAYHDSVDHRQYHRSNDYRYYGPSRYDGGSGVYFGGGRTQVFIGW